MTYEKCTGTALCEKKESCSEDTANHDHAGYMAAGHGTPAPGAAGSAVGGRRGRGSIHAGGAEQAGGTRVPVGPPRARARRAARHGHVRDGSRGRPGVPRPPKLV